MQIADAEISGRRFESLSPRLCGKPERVEDLWRKKYLCRGRILVENGILVERKKDRIHFLFSFSLFLHFYSYHLCLSKSASLYIFSLFSLFFLHILPLHILSISSSSG